VKDSWRTLETLPAMGLDVLVLENGRSKIAARNRADGRYSCPPFEDSDDRWYWDDHRSDGGGSDIISADVTHWQPLEGIER